MSWTSSYRNAAHRPEQGRGDRREAQPRLPADRLKKSDAPIYGVNTGFGSLHSTSIAKKDLAQLQKNLVMSHACGSGDPVPAEIVRAMLVLKVQNMAFGHSAVALSTVQRLVDMHNADMLPVVYERGSLGASGDLAPLAHLSLAADRSG
jgi:histidine ammonia-lyase